MESLDGEIIAGALELIAPGTQLREAIDSIQAARTGALLVLGDSEHVAEISDGGFEIHAPFEAERLFELSKMDGAIIMDDDCSSILRANVHLVPDPSLQTSETGIRHRTAERVSRQTEALVLAVSKRRTSVTIYRGGQKLILQELETVLAKSNQALQTLQRYRANLDEASAHLTDLEFEDVVTLNQVVAVVQSSVATSRVAAELQRYIAELGTEGRLVRMQADELIVSVEEDYLMLLRDYSSEPIGPRKVVTLQKRIAEMSQEQLLEGGAVAAVLGYSQAADVLESHVRPRGFRVLRKIPLLPAAVVGRIVDRYSELREVLRADAEDLEKVDGVGARRAQAIISGLRRVREHSGL